MKENGAYEFFNETQNYLHRNFGVRIRAEIVQRLIEPRGAEMLDIGCGDGGVSIQFLDKNKILFLDLSDKMLALVEKRIPQAYLSRAKMVNGSISNFYPDHKFDIVLAIGLLAHLPSIDDFFKHARENVVKQGGVLILQFSDNESWITRLNHLLAKRYSYKLNRISPKLLISAAKSNGFELKEEIRYGFQLPGMGSLPDGLLYRYAKFIMWSGIGRYFGSEVIWKMEAMK
jgi:ubiquinone/menaquinone biosynthesis C-methylase UbiE